VERSVGHTTRVALLEKLMLAADDLYSEHRATRANFIANCLISNCRNLLKLVVAYSEGANNIILYVHRERESRLSSCLTIEVKESLSLAR
jgi:hypothetical protein